LKSCVRPRSLQNPLDLLAETLDEIGAEDLDPDGGLDAGQQHAQPVAPEGNAAPVTAEMRAQQGVTALAPERASSASRGSRQS